MSINLASKLSPEELEKKVSSLHFFKEIAHHDPQQLRAMIQQSRLYSLAPGETFLRQGDQDTWLYFLMRGELLVCDPADHSRVMGVLISGEVFGEIAVITGEERTMDIVVPDHIREVIVFATNFASLAQIRESGGMGMETKLIVYRQIVQILRWRVELYRTTFPNSELAKVPFKLISHEASGDITDELEAYRDYALFLAVRLQQLNTQLGPIPSASANPTE
ncbi:cyclic nucleotide-binding domain-containing protein [Porticoccus sp.]